jgi:hypothetical protein
VSAGRQHRGQHVYVHIAAIGAGEPLAQLAPGEYLVGDHEHVPAPGGSSVRVRSAQGVVQRRPAVRVRRTQVRDQRRTGQRREDGDPGDRRGEPADEQLHADHDRSAEHEPERLEL